MLQSAISTVKLRKWCGTVRAVQAFHISFRHVSFGTSHRDRFLLLILEACRKNKLTKFCLNKWKTLKEYACLLQADNLNI